MPAGFQSFDASGVLHTEVTDRLTRVVAEGPVSIAPGSSVFIPVAGMVDDGTWFVIVTMGNSCRVGSGGFTAYASSDWTGPFRYTAFRI